MYILTKAFFIGLLLLNFNAFESIPLHIQCLYLPGNNIFDDNIHQDGVIIDPFYLIRDRELSLQELEQQIDSNKLLIVGINDLNLKDTFKKLKDYPIVDMELRCMDIDSIPEEIENIKNLEKLSLKTNRMVFFSGTIKNLKKLMYLDLSENNLIGLPLNIDSIHNLKELILICNPEINLKQTFTSLKNNSSLQKIDLRVNLIKEIPDEIEYMQNLQILLLNSNKIDSISHKIAKLKKLKILSIAGNEIVNNKEKIEKLKQLLPDCQIITDY